MKKKPHTWWANRLHQSQSVLLGMLVFLLPSNWFLKWVTDQSYARGLLIDYLIPKLYLTDLLILLLVIVSILNLTKPRRRLTDLILFFRLSRTQMISLGIGGFFLTLQLFHAQASWWWLLMAGGLIGWGRWNLQHRALYQQPAVIWAWVTGLGVQTGLAIWQFVTQRSLVGYWLLGEPTLSTPFGLATSQWFGREIVLAYGTTPHPNILAGYAVLSWWCMWHLCRSKQRTLQLGLSSLFVGLILLTTWSLSATLGWGLLLASLGSQHLWPQLQKTWQNTQWVLSLIIFGGTPVVLPQVLRFVALPSIQHRVQLVQVSQSFFLTHPWEGVGLNRFAAQLAEGTIPTSLQHFVQPVHHLGWLWLSETGVAGVVVLGWSGYLLWQNRHQLKLDQLRLFALLIAPIAAFDHYLTSQHQGWLLLMISIQFLAISRSNKQL